MPDYLINKEKTDGIYNEVHTTTCENLPILFNRVNLGIFANEIDAVSYAKSFGYPKADGCKFCCKNAHHGDSVK